MTYRTYLPIFIHPATVLFSVASVALLLILFFFLPPLLPARHLLQPFITYRYP